MASPHVDTDPVVSEPERIVQRGHNACSVFQDWVDLLLFALQRRDDAYLEVVEADDDLYSDGSIYSETHNFAPTWIGRC